jgi:uridine kinase
MKKEIKLICEDGRIIETQRGITVAELLKLVNEDGQVIALRINGVASATNMEIMNDAYVKYIRVSDRIGRKIYTKGLQYMYILAIKELYGDNVVVNIKHSIDKGIYTEIKMRRPIDNSVVKAIKNKMKDLVAADLPIKKVSVSRDDAIEYVKSQDENEKILNYTYMTSDYVTMYELEDMYNYFYYVMPVSTKMLNRFDLTFVAPNGIVLSYPIDNTVPKYESIPKVLDAFKNYETKISSLGVKYAGELNKIITKGEISDFIHTNELFYDESLDEIATKVKNNKNIKSIFISGPSSSGKTTTSKKLALFLKSKGIDALVLSTDDYFVERKDSPRREDGSYEFEIVEALDIKLFNMHMKSLLSGKEVIIPTYNFITGEKEYKRKTISLKNNQVLIVEGLHAISEKLNSSIEKKNKLRLYISPFTPLGLDRHNHISTTDIRLLRRMVRDYKHRGYSAEETLDKWLKMRDSEEKYIYPYQREADIVVNTSLAYEIGVLRTYAEPLLYSISKDATNYEEAIRILNFLKGFLNIPSDVIPTTSVLREFIGNSYFE